MELTGKQKRHLRALGHSLRALVQVGRHGVTGTVADGTGVALEAHELVKIRFGQGFDGDVAAAVEELARRVDATVAGRVGRTALLYRERETEPEIRLP
jgi:RNA-binding protein